MAKGNCIIDRETKTVTAGIKTSVIPSDGSAVWIGEGAFAEIDGLISLTIPDAIKGIIGNGTFMSCCDLERVTIGGGIKNINEYSAFEGCSALKTLIISEGVEKIGTWSFNNCVALAEVYLPSTLKTVDSQAFGNCPELKTVKYAGSSTARGKITIDWGNEDLTSATWKYNVNY